MWLECCHSALATIHKAKMVQMAGSDAAKQPGVLLDCPIYRAVYDIMKKTSRAKEGRWEVCMCCIAACSV